MRITLAQAKALGIDVASLPPAKASTISLPEAAPRPSKFVDDGMNKLERRFYIEAIQEFDDQVFREPFKLVIAGQTTYLPDFAIVTDSTAGPWQTCDERIDWIIQGMTWKLPLILHAKVFTDIDRTIQSRQITCYEVKGFMRDDASIKLKVAAVNFPCFRWVLVQRDRGRWRCRNVTEKGFSREEWCPDWLG